ncbi:MAG TPA: NADH-quinone oxidoreductase subunit NuoG [Pseudomonadales bacterium]|nr:NADH-quinone oxidoreductase subunit NuoG [Pseudomonadales bacterium]HNC68853.1 NADH-quinone oxidoreductase subunit NuoG [Pseudomonadales bacterium]
MATIHVDGKSYEVEGSDNLLHACLSLGLNIPYFCWHPALGSVGACRQCAVKMYRDADDRQGRIVMSCMTPSTDNTWISIDDEEAREFRKSVIEFLMVNHPHDCPVCEEGGHCHLQDMTVMSGHSDRRFRFDKRTHHNQDLGPFINHEMNRCIACYRCVRYYNDYADGSDFGVFAAHDSVYFGRVGDGLLENEFSGNLTEVCPTGVFTDRTHSDRYSRKWDMQFAPSVCQQCAVGCNTSAGERYGELRRIENRFNGAVNHYFLCDRGRFGYGYVNRPDRPRQMFARAGSEFEAASVAGGLERVATVMRDARLVGIGSPRASLESNFALQQLVGAANFSIGTDAAEAALFTQTLALLRHGAARTPSLREIESCDAILVLGEDPTMTAPRVALALRQAVRGKAVELAAQRRIHAWQAEALAVIGQDERHPLFIAAVDATRLDDVAQRTLRVDPERIAQIGLAIAHALDPAAPAIAVDQELGTFAAEAANALAGARRPLIVSGTGLRSGALLDACANITRALAARGQQPALTLSLPEANSMGVALLGGGDVEQTLATIDANTVLFVLENDLYRRADAALVDAALARARCIVVIDHQLTRTAQQAHLLLPSASFAEGDGTLVSSEGRAQRYFQVHDPAYFNIATQIRESWRWLAALQASGEQGAASWQTLDEIIAACAREHPALAGIVAAAPDATTRVHGRRIARQPPRYSGRTAMRANISVHEPRVPQDPDSALAFSMEGYAGPEEPGSLIPFAWSPGWNSPQAWNKFQDEVGGHLRAGDSGVRLIETDASAGYATAHLPATQGWQLAPLYHLFGSEELSARAAVTQTLVPAPYVALHPDDARRSGLLAGQNVRVTVGNHVFSAALELRDTLAIGVIGVPAGLPDTGPVLAGSGARLEPGDGP